MKNLCSCGCGQLCNNKFIHGHNLKFRKKNGVVVKCRNCKNNILVPKSKFKENDNNFCNRKCYLEFHTKKFAKVCKLCKKTFTVTRGQMKIRTFCSDNCNNKYKGTIEGRTNNSIKRLEQTRKCDRLYCDAWRDDEYKKEIKKNYCEDAICKGNSINLVLHHIDDDKKNCKPGNLQTLCRSCHARIHGLKRGGINESKIS